MRAAAARPARIGFSTSPQPRSTSGIRSTSAAPRKSRWPNRSTSKAETGEVPMDGLILAGDVGGTKTQLGLFQHSAGSLELVREDRCATADFASLEAVCADFLGASAAVNAACIGVPGPIIDGRGHATNVPWELSNALLSRALNGVPVRLLNDLAGI